MSITNYLKERTANSRNRAAGIVGENLLYTLLTVIPILVLVGVPVVFFVWGSVWSTAPGLGGHFSLAAFQRVLSSELVYDTLLNTLIIAVGATGLAIVLGVVFMIYAIKTNGIGRKFVAPILIAQYLLPTYIIAVQWQLYAGPQQGALNQALILLPFVDSSVLNVYSLWGIIVAGGTNYAGLVYLLTSGGLKAIPRTLEEIGLINGAGVRGVNWRISIPLVLPGVAISGVFIFSRMMQSFGLPIILGLPEQVYVIATLMYTTVRGSSAEFNLAAALGIMLLSITIFMLFFQRRLSGAREKYETITGKEGGAGLLKFDLGRNRAILSVVTWVLLIGLYVVPFFLLLIASFQLRFVGLNFSEAIWTFDWYTAIFVGAWSDSFYAAIMNSAVIAVGAGIFGMLLCTLSSYIMTKTDTIVGDVLDYLTVSPIAIPGIIFGVAYLWLFLSFDPFEIYGTVWILILAFSGQIMMYGTRAVNSSFRAIGQEMEDAARVSGAGITGIFRRVFAPMIYPGVVTGFMLYLITSTKSLTIPILLDAGGNQMLQVFIFRALGSGQPGLVASTATVMVAIIFVLYGSVMYLTDIDITSV